MGEHVTDPRIGELFHRDRVLVPDRVDAPRVPLGECQRFVEHVETPGAEPVDRSEQHIEGIAVEKGRHVGHPVAVVVDLEAEHHREPFGLHRLHHLDVGVEVGPRVVFPVRGHPRPERSGRLVLPETAEEVRSLDEPEEMLGERDLDDSGSSCPLAVRDHLLDGRLHVALGVGPKMEVVVEHAGAAPLGRPAAGRGRGRRCADPLSPHAG